MQFAFRVDEMAIYTGILMTSMWVITNCYAIGYMEREHSQGRFFASFTLCSTAAMGINYASNLFTLFFFYELLTVGVYPMVIHEEHPHAYRGGVVYGSYFIAGAALMLVAFSMIYAYTGTTTLTPGGIPGMSSIPTPALIFIGLCFFLSFGAKAGLMPIHNWLPIAMIAPTPVSAILHAVAVVNMGVYGCIRVIYNVFGLQLFTQLGFNVFLIAVASITLLASAFVAMRQSELKAMLAYSTINQLSYMLLGAVCPNDIGKLGGIVHIFFHSTMKICLFYCAGLMITNTAKAHIPQMKGMAKRLPITMTAFFIAAVGIIGLPPVCGWLSKFYLVKGYFDSQYPIVGFVFILSGIIELGFFSRPLINAFLLDRPGPEEQEKLDEVYHPHGFDVPVGTYKYEATLWMLAPIVTVATLAILYGVWGLFPHMFGLPAVESLLGRTLPALL